MKTATNANPVHTAFVPGGLLLLLLTAVSATAQAPVMSNPTIQAMVHAGAPTETIIRATKTAPRMDLYIN